MRAPSWSSLPCWNNQGGPSLAKDVCPKLLIVIPKAGTGYSIPFRVVDPFIDFQLVEDLSGSQSCRYD